MGEFVRSHPVAITYSIALHIAIAGALVLGFDLTRSSRGLPQVTAIQARVVDESVLREVERAAEAERADQARREREQERPPARNVDGAHREPQCERGRRIGPGLLDEDRRVRQRRACDCRDGGEERPAGRDDPPGEEIRREDRRRHDERLDGLDRLVGRRNGM